MSCGCGANCSPGICPCETFIHPQVIFNPPGRSSIQYRVGDFLSFRHALLLAQPGEIELIGWRPGAQGDLAVQLVEWWAYLADILTFYNERIANEDYLRTAFLPESPENLIRILGYRPRPGIGAMATVAATLTAASPVTLPAAYPVQSKPGPGQQPQIFELTSQTTVQTPDSVSADPAPDPSLLGADGQSVLLKGVVSTIKPLDQLLLLARNWPASGSYAVVVVVGTSPEKDPRGVTNTRITFTAPPSLSGNAVDYRLLRSAQSARVWQYPAATVIQSTQVDLESIVRTIKVNDPVLFSLLDVSPPASPLQLVSVSGYTEAVWFANPPGTDPTQPPAGSPQDIPIPIPHSRVLFASTVLTGATDSTAERQTALIQFAWSDAGTLIPTPSLTLTSAQILLQTPIPSSLLPLNEVNVLVAGSDGTGFEAEATVSAANPSLMTLSVSGESATNPPAPLTVLFNLLAMSRGQTVASEILGSGDASVISGQEFTLQNSPLTYLLSASSVSGADYQSTLRIAVDGVQWSEVPSFFGQPPNAQVFVTREDDQNVTHVQFGDGVNGARLPTGTDNVIATYRYGSGAQSPDAGALSSIVRPWPGLQAILNPVAAGGGADPDPPSKIRRYAPLSVTTFGRAISAADYTSIAAQAPGVSRARSYFVWDPAQQRMTIRIYVGDDQNAVDSANTAIAGASDPNRPVQVLPAQGIPIVLSFSLLVDPRYQIDAATAAVSSALIDPDLGLIGANVVQIGQSIWRSQVEKACLSAPGAVAVHDLELNRKASLRRAVFRTLALPFSSEVAFQSLHPLTPESVSMSTRAVSSNSPPLT